MENLNKKNISGHVRRDLDMLDQFNKDVLDGKHDDVVNAMFDDTDEYFELECEDRSHCLKCNHVKSCDYGKIALKQYGRLLGLKLEEDEGVLCKGVLNLNHIPTNPNSEDLEEGLL